jgi:SAM-dependent methyltransferase
MNRPKMGPLDACDQTDGEHPGPRLIEVDDSTPPKCVTFQPDIYDRVQELLPKDRDARILDVGAGEGYMCRRLKDLGYQIEACDAVPRQFKCPDVPFIKVDLTGPLAIADGQYDCVIGIEVAEHMENHFQFVRELIRITKPGGLIILTTPNVLSFSSRFNHFLYGYTDCAPFPLDPTLEEYYLKHINPISVPEMLFIFERFGADLERLTTNRYRRGCWLPMVLFYPILWLAIRLKFLRKRDTRHHALRRRHIRWVLHPANLMGRITIAVARKRS